MYEIFEQLLKEKGLRPIDVSRGTGLPSSLFSEWKKGKSTPKTAKMQKIAAFFGVSLEYLTTGKNREPVNQASQTRLEQKYSAYVKRLTEMGIVPERMEALIDAIENLKKDL